jgi:hypothetical protein
VDYDEVLKVPGIFECSGCEEDGMAAYPDSTRDVAEVFLHFNLINT